MSQQLFNLINTLGTIPEDAYTRVSINGKPVKYVKVTEASTEDGQSSFAYFDINTEDVVEDPATLTKFYTEDEDSKL